MIRRLWNGGSMYIRTNNELQVKQRKPNILTTIQVRKPEFSGHLVRMSDNRAVNKVFLGKTEGRRKAARPKLTL